MKRKKMRGKEERIRKKINTKNEEENKENTKRKK